jgi:hypothetical protein
MPEEDVMSSNERVSRILDAVGLRSEYLGPLQEWKPAPPDTFQKRHDAFWSLVTALLESEPADYDDLPEWMTEDAALILMENRKL